MQPLRPVRGAATPLDRAGGTAGAALRQRPGPVESVRRVEEQIPMRRLGTPDEVADVIHFLCEKGASYVSGAEIQINGGQHV